MSTEEELQPLTDKQRRFVEEYCRDFNASRAAVRATYSAKTAKQIGHELLKQPHVRAAVEERLEVLTMTAAEALMRLTDIARGDIVDVIEIGDGGNWSLDLQKARRARKTKLIQEISYDRQGRPKVKMYSALEALRDIAKIRGLFVDRVAGPNGEPLRIEIIRE